MPGAFQTWDSYLWEPGGVVLRNLYGERDWAVLARREASEATAQQVLIELGAVALERTYDADHLCAIHKALFGAGFEWAGQCRTVGMGKNASMFAAPAEISVYLTDARDRIRGTAWARLDQGGFAREAATVYAYINQAHPFREGNGRASKLFMQHVAELSPWVLDFRPERSGVSAAAWNDASMLSGPDRGSYEPDPTHLVPVFEALAVPRPGGPVTAASEAARDIAQERPNLHTPAADLEPHLEDHDTQRRGDDLER